MKTKITSIATALIVMASFCSFAAVKTNPLKDLNSVKMNRIYLEAATAGSIEYKNFLFSDEYQYFNTANNVSHSKRRYLSFLKANRGLKFNCETTYQLLDECGK